MTIGNWQLAIGHGMWLLKPDPRNINYVMARIIGNWPKGVALGMHEELVIPWRGIGQHGSNDVEIAGQP